MTETVKRSPTKAAASRSRKETPRKEEAAASSSGQFGAAIAVAEPPETHTTGEPSTRSVRYLFGGSGMVQIRTYLIPSSYDGPKSINTQGHLTVVGYAEVVRGHHISGVVPIVVSDRDPATQVPRIEDLDSYIHRLHESFAETYLSGGQEAAERGLLERIYAADSNETVVPGDKRVADLEDAKAVRKELERLLDGFGDDSVRLNVEMDYMPS